MRSAATPSRTKALRCAAPRARRHWSSVRSPDVVAGVRRGANRVRLSGLLRVIDLAAVIGANVMRARCRFAPQRLASQRKGRGRLRWDRDAHDDPKFAEPRSDALQHAGTLECCATLQALGERFGHGAGG